MKSGVVSLLFLVLAASAAVTMAVWHQPEAADVKLTLEQRNGAVRVRLPRIGAWECGYLDFKGSTVRE